MKSGKQKNEKTPPKRLPKVVWAPQTGPQKVLIDCGLPEIFYGGTRGGGKTDGVLGKWGLKALQYGAKFNAMMFRRTATAAEDAIERSKQIYAPLGGRFNSSSLRWRMPGGGRVGFGYLDTISDADAWQGRNLTDAWVEEVGQYPSAAPIDRLQAVLRSAAGVPTQLILTGNPGGAGQHWVRERYCLHPFPSAPLVQRRTLPNSEVFPVAVIPSRLQDNRILLANDPGYVARLYQVGSAALVAAWLDGDWSKVESAFFDKWSEARNVVEPFTVPKDWLRFRSADWGYASPFSVGWWAVVSDPYEARSLTGAPLILPRGCIVRYREWYGLTKAGEGARLDAPDVGRGIVERESGERAEYGVLDPSAFRVSSGPSIGEQINDVLMGAGLAPFDPADNTRVAGNGALNGWAQMRSRLAGDATGPMAVCFSGCRDSIRTIPALQHDRARMEDLDTDAEDHAADDWRYGCSSRPWVTEATEAKAPRRSDYARMGGSDVDTAKVL